MKSLQTDMALDFKEISKLQITCVGCEKSLQTHKGRKDKR